MAVTEFRETGRVTERLGGERLLTTSYTDDHFIVNQCSRQQQGALSGSCVPRIGTCYTLNRLGSSSYLNFNFMMTEQRYQVRNDGRVDDHLDLLVPSIRQVRQSPDSIHQDLERTKNR